LPALGTSLLELIRRTACDLPADVDHALETALKGEEPGTNGEATLEMIQRSAVRARQERIPLGGDAAALRFTVEAPPGFDRDAFRAAADSAAHAAAEEGILRTDWVDLPTGRPRRGMQLGAPPVIVFRDPSSPAPASEGTKVSLRIVSFFESGAIAMRTLPGPGAPGVPSLDGVVAIALAAIHEQQGRPAGPGLVGIHIGADPVSGLAAAEAELLRPIDDRNPQRLLAQLEARVTERVNLLGIGPLALGGKTTILGAKIAVDPAPADRWAVSIAMSSWALRRQTVTLAADGSIRSWDTALTEEGAAKSAAKLASRFAARKAAERAAEKAEKAEKAARAAAKLAAAAKPAPRLAHEGAILGGRREPGGKVSAPGAKPASGAKSPTPKAPTPKTTAAKPKPPAPAPGGKAPGAAAAKAPSKPPPAPSAKSNSAPAPATGGKNGTLASAKAAPRPAGAATAAAGSNGGKSAVAKPSAKPVPTAVPKAAVKAAAKPAPKPVAKASAKPAPKSPPKPSPKAPPPKSAKKPEKRK
jgi:tartrate/fumarate subfamily iron-sulfur-dependent hydro-lyase alpha chain